MSKIERKLDLSIIIVNYNTEKKALRCLDSILKSDLENINYEVIIVDNNSKENLKNFLEKEFTAERIKIIHSEKNLGMGGGNNLGIERSNGKLILILNPDTIVKKGAIKALYNFILSREDLGIVGPKILNPNGSVQNSCFREWTFWMPLYRRTFLGKIKQKQVDHFLMRDFDHESEREVDWLMGSCLVMRRAILERHNLGFDERFFMYFEDADLCRAIRKLGYKVVYYPEAEIIHDHQRASSHGFWFLAPFFNSLTRAHIQSWFKYFWKWRRGNNF